MACIRAPRSIRGSIDDIKADSTRNIVQVIVLVRRDVANLQKRWFLLLVSGIRGKSGKSGKSGKRFGEATPRARRNNGDPKSRRKVSSLRSSPLLSLRAQK